MLLSLVFFTFGFFILVRGADYFVDGASAFAGRMRMSAMMVGLTVVAMGTSLPELAICITSALNGSSAIAIGNVIGSNVVNVLFVLGILAILSPLMVHRRNIFYEMPFILIIIAVLYCIASYYSVLSRFWAGVLLILFLLYLLYLFIVSRPAFSQTSVTTNGISGSKIILYLAIGLVAVIFGSDIIVKSATQIAEHIGVSERIIGLTVIALGTSLPELVTGIVAVRKNQPDIAVGNIIGSSIFNMLFVLGVGAMVAPMYFEDAFIFDLCMSSIAILMLILCSYRTMRINRIAGIIFLIVYVLYIINLV